MKYANGLIGKKDEPSVNKIVIAKDTVNFVHSLSCSFFSLDAFVLFYHAVRVRVPNQKRKIGSLAITLQKSLNT